MSLVLNDLYDYNLKIYQDTELFKFSLDSLLLAEFVEVKKSDTKILDFCSGNAPIPMIISSKYSVPTIGIEIEPDIYNLALKSVAYNKLENQVKMLNINVLDIKNYFPGNNFDIITCNPPFFKVSKNSLLNESLVKAIARHELKITLEEIIKTASLLLKDNGKFYLVHRPGRLEEIIKFANIYNLHVKEIVFIFSKQENEANMVLLKFVKNANIDTKIYYKIINRDIKTYQNIFHN